MRAILSFFIRYPIWANVILFAVFLLGLASFLTMKKSFFPERTPNMITVSVAYPGAAPEEMEEGITIKIEEALKGIVGIVEVRSVSSENSASITIETSTNYELDEVLTEVKNAVDRINSFPVGAEKPTVFKQQSTSMASFLGLKGDVPLRELKIIAEKIEDDLLKSGLITQVRVSGFPDLEISIEVPEENLSRYGITFTQVANAVRVNNRDVSGGTIKTSEEEIRIRANAKDYDPEVIGNIVLKANADGTRVLLKDIGTVTLGFADIPNKYYSNNVRAVNISVSKLPEEDLLAISEYLDKYVADFNAQNQGVTLFTNFDFYSILEQRIDLLTSNFVLGLVLVMITLGLFLSLRLSFWVAAGIPISFLAMFVVGSIAGITINMLSLFGMLLVVGILVDDGIVISENIYTHFEKGKTPEQAAVDGTLEMMPSVFTSVATTMLAFVTLIFLDNGGFSYEMAVVVIACLGFSLVEAFLILPSHLASKAILSKRKPDTLYDRFRTTMEKGIDFVRFRLYGNSIKFLVQWRWIAMMGPLVFVMMVVGMSQGGLIRFEFFPRTPFDDLQVDLMLKPGTRENITEDYLRRFQDQVWEVHEEMKKEAGLTEPFFSSVDIIIGSGASRTSSGSHVGYVGVNFEDLEGKNISAFEVANRIRKKIGPIPEAENFTVGAAQRWGKPVSIALKGKYIDEIEEAKTELKESLRRIDLLKDITDNSAIGQREIKLELKPLAYFMGLNHQDITQQIRQGFFGEEVQRLIIGTDEVRVWVRYPEEDRVNVSQLESMKIRAANGSEYPLSQLATYEVERGVLSINRFNGKREVRVEADLANNNTSMPPLIEKITADIMPPIMARHPSLEYSFEGQQRRASRELDSGAVIFGLCLIATLLLLMLTTRSYLQPFMIFSLIPLGFICAIFGHWIEDKTVSILSAYGMLALSGVIINDAVVMVDQFNRNLKEGMNMHDAVIDAGISRFRPIVLTSATTVAGLYPIILETSFQAQFLIPMAISIAYGVALGTLFILFFFPVFLMVMNDIRVYSKWLLFGGEKPNKEEVEPAVKEMKKGYALN
ncbi:MULTISPECIES: efflux RND transporter permease subunit [unclassified Imperialibacter]|uniref:efflux RND transporter permease subunit n=1 Tax=unclassified Imperialibacter TaxID=2629706 RepID=UPI00125B1C55|nr:MULTISPECIES: efflux RND transporter permease subunit [unclassified Imperialibacter]CAD5256715.1 Multidrug efflux pump subunit AcrB [Imperialibacter sp. 75]CAD5259572.1 Multidrug efflux pump subunit AcrB [Imperialibacter sp. 89]VVT26264.1 Multidrug efflux pump subunit AcrB [Imperialibacter sp. EC-SDR9]